MSGSENILYLSPDQLPVIEELKQFMREHDYPDIAALLQYTKSELLAKEGFGYRCLLSLHQLLEAHGYAHRLKQH